MYVQSIEKRIETPEAVQNEFYPYIYYHHTSQSPVGGKRVIQNRGVQRLYFEKKNFKKSSYLYDQF